MADRSSFADDAGPYMRPLYSTAMRLSRNRAEAEDLLQETYLRAYRSYGMFRAGTNLGAWLHRILANAHINRYRSAQRRPDETELDTIDDPGVQLRTVDWHQLAKSAEDELLERLAYEAVTDAVGALAAPYRSAVFLADIQGFSYREIAELLDIPIGTVMSRLHRGRSALRRQLGRAA